jgi:prepilin-type processing-associated H-X9-DG protein
MPASAATISTSTLARETADGTGARGRFPGRNPDGTVAAQPAAAFTLLELMITICIILILAGLLFPAIYEVRSLAQSTKCASNLRQCMMAIVMYGDDNNQRIVPSKLYTATAGLPVAAYPYGVHWHDLIEPYVEKQTDGWHNNAFKAITWGCPSWKGGGDDGTGAYNPGYTGYGKSYVPLAPRDWHLDSQPDADAWNWHDGFEIFRFSQIFAPADRILLGDSVQWQLMPNYGTGSPSDRGSWPNWSGDPARHRGNANYAFFDGHVKMLDQYRGWDGVFGIGN